ncbi:MAG: hypothetical protein J6I62_05135 [Selenomonadaceae bacterium]|nr:hypothetical protein [Selenomonadaceae bacterium]
MDENLMDREVLCILDTRKIQRYVFTNSSFGDTMGGSDLIKHILSDAIRFALEDYSSDEFDLNNDPDAPVPYFDNPKIKAQQIICAAGNALLLVRRGELAQKIIRKVSRYYLEHAYSLDVVAAAVAKTDNLDEDIFNLYAKLDKIKATAHIIEPQDTLPVLMREERTGLPVIAKDEEIGDYISRATQIRRIERRKRINNADFGELPTTKHFDGKDYWGVLHLDGNNFGISISGILQSADGYAEGIRARRQVNLNIVEVYERLLNSALAELKELYDLKRGKDCDFSRAFKIVHQGGDDLNCVGDASLMLPFLRLFYKHLKGEFLWNTPKLKIPLYICGGVAFVTKDFSFHRAFRLAGECIKNAKTYAKKPQNLINGYAGNWIDFQISSEPNAEELDAFREKAYDADGLRMDLRPYSMDGDDERSFCALLNRIKALRQFSNEKIQMLRMVSGMGKQTLSQWISLQKQRGEDLKAVLGEPFYTGDTERAAWFDATELMDFAAEV